MNQLSSAYSDDGGQFRDRSNTEYRALGQRDLHEEVDMTHSVTANISEHRARLQERPDEDHNRHAIYELPDEDEHASSPPGSLSHQDVMSENIPTRLEIHKFERKTDTKLAKSVFPDQMSDNVSKEVQASYVQKNICKEARVSETVALVETSRSI